MIKELLGRMMMVALALTFCLSLTYGTVGEARRVAGIHAGNCTVCHKGHSILPVGHADTKVMTYKDCLKCHEKTGPARLEEKLPASHIHGLNGVTCAKCHGKQKKPEELETDQCTACHGTEGLALKTAAVKPANPHNSPHYGPSLDCNLCHHQHRRSENYCSQCHKFDFTVP